MSLKIKEVSKIYGKKTTQTESILIEILDCVYLYLAHCISF